MIIKYLLSVAGLFCAIALSASQTTALGWLDEKPGGQILADKSGVSILWRDALAEFRFSNVMLTPNEFTFPASRKEEVMEDSLKSGRTPDVVYDHRDGIALVMDVIKPKKQNGIAVIYTISGGWYCKKNSDYNDATFRYFTDRGQTVFIMSHGSRDIYKLPEIIKQAKRAVQFVRYHATRFGINPNLITMTGKSAGGHLSLMVANTGEDAISEPDYRIKNKLSDKDKVDPVNLVSTKIPVVGCFCPPTDLEKFGTNGIGMVYVNFLNSSAANSSAEALAENRQALSPFYHITPNTPPTLIFHGTADKSVPFSHSEAYIKKLKDNHVPCDLVPRIGEGHSGWKNGLADFAELAEWYEKQMLK